MSMLERSRAYTANKSPEFLRNEFLELTGDDNYIENLTIEDFLKNNGYIFRVDVPPLLEHQLISNSNFNLKL